MSTLPAPTTGGPEQVRPGQQLLPGIDDMYYIRVLYKSLEFNRE